MNSPRKASNLWKGKSTAPQPEDASDPYNPTITYRQLLSQNLGARDPLRVIALCDSDAFYANCEMVRLGIDKDTPLVVLQWQAIIAVNYAARKYGISRMDKITDAQKRCPELVVVHVATYKEGEKEPGYWDDVDTNTHKVSLDYYRQESMKISAMFKEALPGCEIEKASIDEAFIDFTKRVREILLERYPYLAQVPPNAPFGPDTPLPPPPPIKWYPAGLIIPSIPVSSDDSAAGSSSSHHARHEDDESVSTWHDVAMNCASELMAKAREEVYTKLGYSTSAGIARNKFLAKLTASYKKPNGQSILKNSAIAAYLNPMPFQKIRFLGGKLGKALAKEFDATTVGDLLSIDLEELQNKFGEDSIWVYEVLRGIDRSEVKEKKSSMNKSMLASKNLPKPITNASEGFHWIRVLAAELALRLNNARQISPNLWPKTIVLHAKKGYEAGRSKQAPFPFTRDLTVDYIAAAGDKLWKELVGTNVAMKVTSVQLAFAGVETAETGQQSIEGFFKAGHPGKRSRDDNTSDDSQTGLPGVAVADHVGPGGWNADNVHASSFKCSRCGRTITLPKDMLGIDETVEKEALAVLKVEHDDFHFAQDLAKSEGSRPDAENSLKPKLSPAKKKRRKEAVGIERFFNRT